MDPPARPLILQNGISPEVWNRYKETIRRLYMTEGRKLADVSRIMEREHGFRAT